MRVGKAATAIRNMHSKHSYVFGEENERLVTLRKKFFQSEPGGLIVELIVEPGGLIVRARRTNPEEKFS